VILKAIRHADRIWISDVFARFMRKVGPWRREHRIGRANLAAAFPEKSPAEIEQILAVAKGRRRCHRGHCAFAATPRI